MCADYSWCWDRHLHTRQTNASGMEEEEEMKMNQNQEDTSEISCDRFFFSHQIQKGKGTKKLDVFYAYANVVNKGIGDKTHGTSERVCIAMRFGVQKNDANCPYANYSIFAESKCSRHWVWARQCAMANNSSFSIDLMCARMYGYGCQCWSERVRASVNANYVYQILPFFLSLRLLLRRRLSTTTSSVNAISMWWCEKKKKCSLEYLVSVRWAYIAFRNAYKLKKTNTIIFFLQIRFSQMLCE